MVRIAWIIILINCFLYKSESPINKPPDTKEALAIVESIPVNTEEQKRKVELVKQTLRECQIYGESVYAKFTDCVREADSIRGELAELKKKIDNLEEEISPWRAIKRSFWLIIAGILVFGAVRLYLKLKPI